MDIISFLKINAYWNFFALCFELITMYVCIILNIPQCNMYVMYASFIIICTRIVGVSSYVISLLSQKIIFQVMSSVVSIIIYFAQIQVIVMNFVCLSDPRYVQSLSEIILYGGICIFLIIHDCRFCVHIIREEDNNV